MKRNRKTSRLEAPPLNTKLPEEFSPIVDAVVEVVFERLRSATQKTGKAPPLKRKTAKLNLPLPKQRTAFAEALADLLLADLASGARAGKPKSRSAAGKGKSRRTAKKSGGAAKTKARRAEPLSKRAPATPKRRRAKR